WLPHIYRLLSALRHTATGFRQDFPPFRQPVHTNSPQIHNPSFASNSMPGVQGPATGDDSDPPIFGTTAPHPRIHNAGIILPHGYAATVVPARMQPSQ